MTPERVPHESANDASENYNPRGGVRSVTNDDGDTEAPCAFEFSEENAAPQCRTEGHGGAQHDSPQQAQKSEVGRGVTRGAGLLRSGLGADPALGCPRGP